MGLFKKKKDKARKSIVDSDHDLQNEVEGEMLPQEAGLAIDEIERLLELLGRENRERPVYRRRVGSVLDLAKRLAFWVKANRITLEQAQEVVHTAVVKQQEQRQRGVRKKRTSEEGEAEAEQPSPRDITYPTQLSPDDVLNATKMIRQMFDETTLKPERETAEDRRARRIFEALEQLKNEEATRFARYVASVQRQQILSSGNSIDQSPTGDHGEMQREEDLDEEDIERIRTLEGFGKKNLKTLIDEAGNVVDEDVGAAAKVLQQWIGSVKVESE